MKMSFGCEVAHEPERPVLGHTVRASRSSGALPHLPGPHPGG